MPLLPGDLEIWPPKLVTIRDRNGKPVSAYEIRLRVRGTAEDVIWIPREVYSPEAAERDILIRAEQLISLSDKYPVKG